MADSPSEKSGAASGPEKSGLVVNGPDTSDSAQKDSAPGKKDSAPSPGQGKNESVPGTVDSGPELNKDKKQETRKSDDSRGDYHELNDPEQGGKASENHQSMKRCCCECPVICACCVCMWDFVVKFFKCIAIIIVLCILAIVLGLIFGLGKKGAATEGSIPSTAETSTPKVVPTTSAPTPYPGKVFQGVMRTTENYTMALDNTESAAYKTFVKNFTETMDNFYAGTNFTDVYDRVGITKLMNEGRQVEIFFEVYVLELDDLVRPNALTVLDQQLATTRFGKFRVITHRLTSE